MYDADAVIANLHIYCGIVAIIENNFNSTYLRFSAGDIIFLPHTAGIHNPVSY